MLRLLKTCQQYLFPCFLLIPFCLSGCFHKTPLSSRYEISPIKPDGLSLTKNIMLVADNQLNHLYGDPIWLRSEFTDKIVRVAIRPVQQDLFGQDILRWALDIYGSRMPIIHLGDATNLACSGEFDDFVEIMSTAKKPWFMIPGNHDAYLFGNMHFNLGEWKSACRRAGRPMTKDLFVRRYIAHLQNQHKDFQKDYPGEIPDKGVWHAKKNNEVFLKSIAWEINKKHPYRSFVLQRLDLGLPNSSPSVNAILLDTVQYSTPPTLVPTPLSANTGINGDILPEQFKFVRSWLQEDRTKEKITILIGHHPFDRLLKKAKNTVDNIRIQHQIALYISAHTHNGEYIARGGSKGDEGWLELNVGSIVDWPIEFRSFSIQQIQNDPDKFLFRSSLFRIPDAWSLLGSPYAPQCDPHWEAKPEDPDYYLSYAGKSSPDPNKTQEDLINSILYTYRRLFEIVLSADENQNWPECCPSHTDVLQTIDQALSAYSLEEKISLAIKLGEFDRFRMTADPQIHRDYRLCQGVWAAKYDKLQRRSPLPQDAYIIFPRR